jgi:GH25 family lysozyme M1 (1,4-beta-N-acetylmuramidase)
MKMKMMTMTTRSTMIVIKVYTERDNFDENEKKTFWFRAAWYRTSAADDGRID